ncbi:UDP-N-acetylmuramoyl-L-alanine--D-glutamate ligase [Marinilabilia salmonicolor]|jgi:UDP-N-acetylmuramoylalanine--D-glutamate ligase|uniref:UDP-N-acetylmuramoylalanine--D-glutamate ligase n=1 Tax=Marinilabilia salmonicolor TaxID=989 RepID=A0A2T0XTN8_9BACT|nr:UDP-N-acetylmuramoyl-L-alanine--D-glutamate ligase [Marinilabilia salmonicolor]PRZ02311.1 UDP-N-acetylmuramoylalanine--D-glutamate ligase [Marinilabilia salmonicolor]RCW30586.1 UDP-N-acetylmuramoylalanine--D-glutamate ligase [Marinilabilia salmonicolor]
MEKELIVLGAGESGTGAALLAKAKGFSVFVSDCGKIKPQHQAELEFAGIDFESGRHSEERILNAIEVVKSPGIPDHSPLVRALGNRGISVISEIEFAGRYSKAKMVGVTGSNGKTTTAMWIYHLMKKSGLDVVLAGNVGNSMARELLERDPDIFVLELSSFQLDGMKDFKCHTSIITNITPDHLDRYDYKFENYVDAKFRILNNHTSDDIFIFNAHDKEIMERLKMMRYPGHRCPFAFDDVYGEGACVDGEKVVFNTPNHHFSIPAGEIALPGKHNLSNAMAASLAALRMGASGEAVKEGLKDFPSVAHRLEGVTELNGVLFINDSKATNIDSAWYALESMERPVIWIAGGTDKGNDYSELEELAVQKVKHLICLGVDNTKLMAAFGNKLPGVSEAKSMSQAVEQAVNVARPGDVVLLSPACASFDLFDNYVHRGDLFKAEVKKHEG